MPSAAPRWCPRCRLPHPAGTECPVGAAERRAEVDRRRPSARQRGYDSDWERYRSSYLKRHPHCACGARAVVVDHITPVALGGPFWDPGNHRQMCGSCHASKTTTEINQRRVPRHA
jgi:5-methylcytosine-specific restriction enzyme A